MTKFTIPERSSYIYPINVVCVLVLIRSADKARSSNYLSPMVGELVRMNGLGHGTRHWPCTNNERCGKKKLYLNVTKTLSNVCETKNCFISAIFSVGSSQHNSVIVNNYSILD